MEGLDDITHAIQLSIAPVFLLTAIAGFLNALVARLGRAIDRRRALEELVPAYEGATLEGMRDELRLLARRIKYITSAIGLAVLSAIFICILIGTAFLGGYVGLALVRTIAMLFVVAILALTICLLAFFREVILAANATQHQQPPKLDA
jgi:hypothetical protein